MKSLLIFAILLCTTITSCHLNGQNSTESTDIETQCEYENLTSKLGVGMLIWDGNCSNDTEIYEDRLLSKAMKVNLCDYEKSICPYFYKPDYEIAHFVVNDIHSDSYEILYNFDEKGYIKKGTTFQFKPWNQYLIELPLGANVKGDSLKFEILNVAGDSLLINES